ncbi:MAG: transposase [Desulfomonilaceae bacterium]|nr:transposase [Desulfomonilaceae bacterium]
MKRITNLPKRKTIRLPGDAYRQNDVFSVTIAASHRHPWFHIYVELADVAVQLLADLASERKTSLYAWCIMPDHVHLLLQDEEIVEFLRLFKGRMTPKSRRLDPTRTLWQRSFYDHALRKDESLETVAVYIWQNPVRLGIVDHAFVYPWSGSLVWPNWRQFFL